MMKRLEMFPKLKTVKLLLCMPATLLNPYQAHLWVFLVSYRNVTVIWFISHLIGSAAQKKTDNFTGIRLQSQKISPNLI